MAGRIGLELRVRPVRQLGAQLLLREAHPLRAGEIGRAAAEHHLGLVVERAQELALPAGPDAGPDRLDVGDGEHEQELQALHGLHHLGEALDRRGIREVAALRRRRHQQMVLDEPGHGLGLRLGRGRSAGRACGRWRRRPSNGPPAGPWRCRAGTAPRRARGGCGSSRRSGSRADARSPSCPASISASTPIERIRCSSTV